MDGGERTFKANFTAEGVALLQERVKEKLKELTQYTDDTLAEYIVVLLRNGRRKAEVAKELQVFLATDNDAFVSWLWDHLSSSLHLYVQPKVFSTNDDAKSTRSSTRGLPVHGLTSSVQTSREPEAETQKTTKTQQKRVWGGIVRDQPEPVSLRSVVATVSHAEDNTSHKSNAIRRNRSPDHQRKRSREEDTQQIKVSKVPLRTPHQAIGATRRLLQFAVRDAVRPVQPVTPRSESASKRLRSVVSTMGSDSAVHDRSQKIYSETRAPGASAALRAVAEAANDVLKDRYPESVFNRLGRKRLSHATEESFAFREQNLEGEYEDRDNGHAEIQVDFHDRNQYVRGDSYIYDRETEKSADFAVDVDRYDDTSAAKYNGPGSYRSTLPSVGRKESSIDGFNMVQGAAVGRSRRSIAQDKHASSGPRPSEKIFSTSVNSNTQKPPYHGTASNALTFEPQVPMETKGTISRKTNVTAVHAKDTPMTDNSHDIVHSSTSVEAQKVASVAAGSYSTGQPEGDADSRTVFVSNVHFAATKDALSRHFNKFGAVLKTLIMTDGLTGQPTGSVYIEFLNKESAAQALTLNGTSFMSRILKVIRKSSAEVPQQPGWSRASRGSSFASRLTRTAYPRPAFSGAIRGRLAPRGGGRSFQWKRGAADSTDAGKPSPSSPVTPGSQQLHPVTRSFTYTRTEAKQDGGTTVAI